MSFARIVGSTSHVMYVARVLGESDSEAREVFGFGTFVVMSANGANVVGVVCDSRLVNPEFARAAPGSSPNALSELSRDQIDSNKALVAILLLGSFDGSQASHDVPRKLIPSGTSVDILASAEIKKFHTAADGSVQLRYLPDLISQAGALAVPLVKYIVAEVGSLFPEPEQRRLKVMADTLAWKHTFGESRF